MPIAMFGGVLQGFPKVFDAPLVRGLNNDVSKRLCTVQIWLVFKAAAQDLGRPLDGTVLNPLVYVQYVLTK